MISKISSLLIAIAFGTIFSANHLNAGLLDKIKDVGKSIGDTAKELSGKTRDAAGKAPESDANGSDSESTVNGNPFNVDRELVRQAQSELKRLGYRVSVDGLYGPGTRKAVSQFQQTKGLAVTGDVSPGLISSLQATSAQQQLAAASGPTTPENTQATDRDKRVSAKEITYQNLLESYIASHHDLLNSDAFAWQYFKAFEAPNNERDPECQKYKNIQADNISFQEFIKDKRAQLSGKLKRLQATPQTFRAEINKTITLDPYDISAGTFPVHTQVHQLRFDLRSCNFYFAWSGGTPSLGPTYTPNYFHIKLANLKDTLKALPADRNTAQAIQRDSRNRKYLRIKARIELALGPIPFLDSEGSSSAAEVIVPNRIVGVTVYAPDNQTVLHTYPDSHFAIAQKGDVEDANAQQLASSGLPHLNSHLATLALVKAHPGLLTERALVQFTTDLITSESSFWRNTNTQIARDIARLKVGGGGTLNRKQPFFLYPWQSLRESSPATADSLFDVFLFADAPWRFYTQEPNYDQRLDAWVEVSLFDPQTLGIHAPTDPESLESPSAPYESFQKAELLAPKLAPIVKAHLLGAAKRAPNKFRIDIPLKAKYDTVKGILRFSGKQTNPGPDSPSVTPLSPSRVSYAANDARVTSILSLVPASAEGRFIFRLPHVQPIKPFTPSRRRSQSSPLETWREKVGYLISSSNRIATLQHLALDRNILIEPITMPSDLVNSIGSSTFSAIARIIVSLNTVDIVKVAYQQKQHTQAIFAASVAGIEIIGPNDELVANIPVQSMASAAEFKAKKLQEAEAQVQAEAHAKKAEQGEISQNRKSLEEKAEIVGLRIGMPFPEADGVIRNRMPVGWVAALDFDASQFVSRRNPYATFKTYIRDDGQEEIVLFHAPGNKDQVVAVARDVVISSAVTPDQLAQNLMKKYGTNPVMSFSSGSRQMVWAADFGTISAQRMAPQNQTAKEKYSRGTCAVHLTSVSRLTNTFKPIEGILDRNAARQIDTKTPMPTINGGRRKNNTTTNVKDQSSWDPTAWEGCGPTVIASYVDDNDGKSRHLSVMILNLATYGTDYARLLSDMENTAAGEIPDL